jgi:MFS transporter, PAT family, solute carrier family 33 (acetyl-CoA transportor), member 1
MLALGPTVEGLLATADVDMMHGAPAYVQRLTVLFFGLYLLMATQDVAVDGWALTLLSRRNVGLASTVNVVAQTFGYFLAYTGFLTLSEHGLVTLTGFMRGWGIIFVCSALVVAATKEASLPEGSTGSVSAVYAHAAKLLHLRSVQRLLLVLLTCRAAFGAADALTTFKLIETGFTKAQVAYITTLIAPLNILLPLFIAKWTNGDAPWAAFLHAYPVRLGVNLLMALVLAHAPGHGAPRASFTACVIAVLAAQAVASQVQFVAQMSFFARVSDPSIGGTAMTLFNTVANLGSKWPSSLALFLAEPLTRRVCRGGTQAGAECGTAATRETCLASGGTCITMSDAFMPLTLACTLLGIAWMVAAKRHVLALQQLPHDAWLPNAQYRSGGRARMRVTR